MACGMPALLKRAPLPRCQHLVGGGGMDGEYGKGPQNSVYAPDQDYVEYEAVARDPDDYDLLRYSSGSPRNPTGLRTEEDADDEESESWTVQEPLSVRKRREEEELAVQDFGGDLSVVGKGKQGLVPRDWDKNEPIMDERFVSYAQKRALEEKAQIQAVGGGLDTCFAEAKPSAHERYTREWEAMGTGSGEFIPAKQLKEREEAALMMTFGGDLSAMRSRDETRLRRQSWEAGEDRDTAAACQQVVSAVERRRREEERAIKAFGGGLENCVKRESALEREKREFKLRGKVKRKSRAA